MLDKTDMVMENIEVRHIPVGASYVLDSSLGQHDIGGSIRGQAHAKFIEDFHIEIFEELSSLQRISVSRQQMVY